MRRPLSLPGKSGGRTGLPGCFRGLPPSGARQTIIVSTGKTGKNSWVEEFVRINDADSPLVYRAWFSGFSNQRFTYAKTGVVQLSTQFQSISQTIDLTCRGSLTINAFAIFRK